MVIKSCFCFYLESLGYYLFFDANIFKVVAVVINNYKLIAIIALFAEQLLQANIKISKVN